MKIKNEKTRRLLAGFLREGLMVAISRKGFRVHRKDPLACMILGAMGTGILSTKDAVSLVKDSANPQFVEIVAWRLQQAIWGDWSTWLPWLDGPMDLIEEPLPEFHEMPVWEVLGILDPPWGTYWWLWVSVKAFFSTTNRRKLRRIAEKTNWGSIKNALVISFARRSV